MASNKPEKIDDQIIKIRRKISLPGTNNRNIHFFNLGPLVWILGKVTIPQNNTNLYSLFIVFNNQKDPYTTT